MTTDTHAQMNLHDTKMRESSGNYGEVPENNIELLLKEHQHPKYNNVINDKDRDRNINRCGSAPPTVEGSLSALESMLQSDPNFLINTINAATNTQAMMILSDEEIRSHPAYLSYYYSLEHLNPRLPPPILSREHWRMAQRFNSWAPTAEGEMVSSQSSSLFSVQPILSPSVKEAIDDHEMMGFSDFKIDSSLLRAYSSTDNLDQCHQGSISDGAAGLGMRRKSFADILQEGLERPASKPIRRLSRPASHSCLSKMVDETGATYNQHPEIIEEGLERPASKLSHRLSRPASHSCLRKMADETGTTYNQHPEDTPTNDMKANGSSLSHSILSARPATPRIPTAMKRVVSVDNIENISRLDTLNRALSSSMNNLADLAASISLLSQSINQGKHEDYQELLNSFTVPKGYDHSTLQKSSPSYRSKAPPGFTNLKESNISYQRPTFSSITSPVDKKQDFSNYLDKRGIDGGVRTSPRNHCPKTPPGFPICQTNTIPSISSPVEKPSGSSVDKKLNFSNHLDKGGSNPLDCGNGQFLSMQKASSPHFIHSITSPGNSTKGSNEILQQALNVSQAEALLCHPKNQYNQLLQKSTALFPQPCNPNTDFCSNVPYKGNVDTVLANGRNACLSTIPLKGNIDVLTPPLLDDLKGNKPKPLELIDIVDNVFDFSKDQYGSRFIQQKLETATVEEKAKIFPEIKSHARALTTDVFGNYVIQKFFDHGTESQRKDLAKQLVGHVLPFSLQMYGCRVVQKALEVVDVEQQTVLVSELDGSIMKCVCDQNGNHVIQKCIQCIPQEKIRFIIESFYGQIAALSTHPYGCRVIQRVLEHCDDPKSQKIIIDEIVHSACTLAQDQYGNYVVQHVIQHGKAHEQSAIISKMAGQIVKMSKQKFASNVVEKCLTFGGPEDRQLIVKEMLGTTDENEPLQEMTKDPFGNYVVQKVLETCDPQSCELIVSRLKHHLTTLKRYTYGKHIVSRVEKLITAGEGRGGILSSH